MVCSKLQYSDDVIAGQIRDFRARQIREADPFVALFEQKNAALIEELKATKLRESEVRLKVDSLSHKTQKAKNSVKTAAHLWMSDWQKRKQKNALGVAREERAEALKELERLVTCRTVAQNEILNVSSILAELKADCDKRNYFALIKAVASKFFLKTFGRSTQTALAPLIKVRTAHTLTAHTAPLRSTPRLMCPAHCALCTARDRPYSK
jgi:hypothetical protein